MHLYVNGRLSLEAPQAHDGRLDTKPKSALAAPSLGSVSNPLQGFYQRCLLFCFVLYYLPFNILGYYVHLIFIFIVLQIFLPNDFPS